MSEGRSVEAVNLFRSPVVPSSEMANERSMEQPAITVTLTFSDLAEVHLPKAYRLAVAILGDDDEAADAVQESVIAAWRNWPHLRNVASFESWFTRIIVNQCRDELRRRARRKRAASTFEVQPTLIDSTATAQAERDLVYQALGALGADDRILLIVRYFEDAPLERIAERLGLPLGTVKSRLHAATARFRIALTRLEVSS